MDLSGALLGRTNLDFSHYLYHEIDWSDELIGVKGARETGKTTLLLQYLKQLDIPINQKLYLLLDDIYFT